MKSVRYSEFQRGNIVRQIYHIRQTERKNERTMEMQFVGTYLYDVL